MKQNIIYKLCSPIFILADDIVLKCVHLVKSMTLHKK